MKQQNAKKKQSIDLTTICPLKTLVDVNEDTNNQLSTVDQITKQIRIDEPFEKERVQRNNNYVFSARTSNAN